MSAPRYFVPCSGCGWLLPVERSLPVVRFCASCARRRQPVQRRRGAPDVFAAMAARLVRRGLASHFILADDDRSAR